jgi:hypothetical protein
MIIRWLKWKLVWCIIFVCVSYVWFKTWCKESLLYKIAIYFRLFIVIDLVFTVYHLSSKYNERFLANFYYNCIYLGFLIVLFIMINKFLKALQEDKNGNTA